jgi:hypothetical protein
VTEQGRFLERLVRLLDEAGIPAMVAGSLASSFHGQPRTTNDVDVVIAPTPERLEKFLAAVGAEFYVSPDAARRALAARGMFNVIESSTGWKADFILRKDRPFSAEEFGRRRPAEILGVRVSVAAPEDVILSKLEWAGRSESERQIRDAASVIAVQGAALDRAYLTTWAARLGVEVQLKQAYDQVEKSRLPERPDERV